MGARVTPLRKRWIVLLEKLLDRYHEGPEPPVRLAEEVQLFERMYPDASIDAWRDFTIAMAAKAYRDGYLRGLEWEVRDLNTRDQGVDPEVQAQADRHGWSLSASSPTAREILERGDPNDPLSGIPRENRAGFLAQLGAAFGAYGVVVVAEQAAPEPGDDETDPAP